MIAKSIWSNYFQTGKTALSTGDSSTAEAMFNEALQYASEHSLEPLFVANSAFGLALALVQLDSRKSEAQQLMRKAVRLYSTVKNLDCSIFVGCVSRLADSYCQERFPERAIPLLKQAVKVVAQNEGLAAPNLVPLFKRMALIYCEKNYHEKAEAYFKRST